ncbi:hypothetical protein TRFO_29684 [Tritrichomonas foetus]|uniref:Uncharacterized protein n=1 Tax=Tritrichomonas foetus TaxID=1144522 RepID=A0A1J4JVJ2_9EUKA|nr:hypothetical protein TRFO_29684 [Tritrichomonas foetus]|eukprot:OHT03027.1 hypothetical protein TRFO_29684 [Tritrichomonas foetus]
MTASIEWIRNFLLVHSTTTPKNILNNNGMAERSVFAALSTSRYQLLNPGNLPFIKHTFYSIFISIVDHSYDFENSNFSQIRSYLLRFLPNVDISINELENNNFSSSHLNLSRDILKYYLRFHFNPSTISPTCFGKEIESYENAFNDWGRSICKNEFLSNSPNFIFDFGTGQIPAMILSKLRPELIRLNRITFSKKLSSNEISKNWREIEAALSVIGIRKPTELEQSDKLCMLCFATDLFKKVYFDHKINNDINYINTPNSIYCSNLNMNMNNFHGKNELDKVDFLINQMNSLSNGNPNIFLSAPVNLNPINVQHQKLLQEHQNANFFLRQQMIQNATSLQNQMNPAFETKMITNNQYQNHIKLSNELKMNNNINSNLNLQYEYNSNDQQTINAPDFSSYKPSFPHPNETRITICSNQKTMIKNDAFDTRKLENIHNQVEKFKLISNLEKIPSQKPNKEKQKKNLNNDPIKNRKKDHKLNPTKKENTPQFQAMSSFAIDPTFPNQSIQTTSIELIKHKLLTENLSNEQKLKLLKQYKKLKRLQKLMLKQKPQIVNNDSQSSIKCSYVTFNNAENQNQNNTQENNHAKLKSNSANHRKHQKQVINRPILKKNSLFDDVLSADNEIDFSEEKTSHDFINHLKKEKDLLKKEFNGYKKGSELMDHINSFIEQQKEAIAVSSIVKNVKKSSIKRNDKIPDSSFNPTNPQSSQVFEIDPLLELNDQQKKSNLSNKEKKGNSYHSLISDPIVNISSKENSSAAINAKNNIQNNFHSDKKPKDHNKSNETYNQNLPMETNLKSQEFHDPFDTSSISKDSKMKITNDNNFDPFDSNSNISDHRNNILKTKDKKENKKNEPQFNKNSDILSNSLLNVINNKPNQDSKQNDALKANISNIGNHNIQNSLNYKSSEFSSDIQAVDLSINNSQSSKQYSIQNSIQNSAQNVVSSNQITTISEKENHLTSELTFSEISKINQPKSFGVSDLSSKFTISKTNKDILESKTSNKSVIKPEIKSEMSFPVDLSINTQSKMDISDFHAFKEKFYQSENISQNKTESIGNYNNGKNSEDLSIDLNSSEIPTPSSSSSTGFNNANNSLNNISLNIESKISNSQTNQNSQSSTRVESTVDEFIPEIEKYSSESKNENSFQNEKRDTNDKTNIKTNNQVNVKANSQTNDKINSNMNTFDSKNQVSLNNGKSKSGNSSRLSQNHSSSSSSSDSSIPFKIIKSDSSDSNEQDSTKGKQLEINNDNDKSENSKPVTSVIEEFDLSSLRQSRNKRPIPVPTPKAFSGPILLENEPVPKEQTKTKGPSSETRRVSFAIDMKLLAASYNNTLSNINHTQSTSNSNIEAGEDTFMSTNSMNHSFSIPIEERLRMYSREHTDLSLSFSETEPEIIKDYREATKSLSNKEYIWLSNDENAVLESLLPIIAATVEVQDIKTVVSKEVGLPKNHSSVARITANIITFLKEKKLI